MPSLGRYLVFASLWVLAAGPLQAQTIGVRNRIDASVSVEPDSPLLTDERGAAGALSFTMRLSANSTETRYFGMISPSFPTIVVPDKGAVLVPQTKIWEEDKCHQRRGLPKTTVTAVSGSFGAGKDHVDIAAIWRHIGLPIPSDELTPGIKLAAGSDDIGSYYAWRAQTRNSRIDVDLKVYSFDCALESTPIANTAP